MAPLPYAGQSKRKPPPPKPKVLHDVGRGEDRWTVEQIAVETGCAPSTIAKRVVYGITGAALLEPKRGRSAAKAAGRPTLRPTMSPEPALKPGKGARAAYGTRYDVGGGRKLTQKQIAHEVGCSLSTVSKRLQWGVTGPELLEPVQARFTTKRLIEKCKARVAAERYRAAHPKYITTYWNQPAAR